jgi:hypothetical protein
MVAVMVVVLMIGILFAQETPKHLTSGPMTPHNIVQFYGTNVFKIRLEIAERFYGQNESAEESLHRADEFIDALLHENRKDLYERYHSLERGE